jgi:hypothetical protein
MTDTPRNDIAALAGLAFAGLAAYAGYRAIDAERKLENPTARPLNEHIVETAKADLAKFRTAIEDCLEKAAASLNEFAEKIEAKAEDMKARAEAPANDARDEATPSPGAPTV